MACPPVPGDAALADRARQIVRSRSRLRTRLGPDLFGDPAYDMLLELFAAGEEGGSVSLTSLALVTDLPMSTALRWIRLLEQRKLVARVPDPSDGRRWFVHLEEAVRASVGDALRELQPDPARASPVPRGSAEPI